MKYNDIKTVDTKVSINDNVVNDIKPKKSFGGFMRKHSLEKIDMYIIPIIICTAVSIGFLIAQIAKLASVSSTLATIAMML